MILLGLSDQIEPFVKIKKDATAIQLAYILYSIRSTNFGVLLEAKIQEEMPEVYEQCLIYISKFDKAKTLKITSNKLNSAMTPIIPTGETYAG